MPNTQYPIPSNSSPPTMSSFLLIAALIFLAAFDSATSQQSYGSSLCDHSTTAHGYACNGLKTRCPTYLIYRAMPPYDNASSIANLFSSDASRIAHLNNISESAVLVTGKEVIVPISCSCAGSHYQSNTTYTVRTNDNPYHISNATFQGLTTCKAIQSQRSGLVVDMFPGESLTIPLRCACPTKNQSAAGINYLMTYLIKSGDTISTISLRFGNNDVGETLLANKKSEQDFIIQPFTTLLVPLRNPPNSTMTVTPKQSPSPNSVPITSPTSPPPPASSQGPSKKWDYFVYGLVAGGGFVLLLGVVAFYLLVKRTRRRKDAEVDSEKLKSTHRKPAAKNPGAQVDIEPMEFLNSRIAQSLKVYSFKDLQSATDNFSTSSQIGGSVYLGLVNDDQHQQEVAIKQTSSDISGEIEILNKINHFNIITLHGVCYNEGLWYLVYEYASSGPLSDWIYPSEEDGTKPMSLSWTRRVQIALDVATGLDYLHCYTSPPHIHKDINCSHILLDRDFRAKISHFGLSKSVGGQKVDHFTFTKHIVGTKGYMAPEYLENGLITPKIDVFAFGILVLEMLAGREASLLNSGEGVKLSAVLETLLAEGKDANDKFRSFMDPNLQDNYPIDVADAMVRLAEKCVIKEAGGRPSMDEVVRLLSKALTSSFIWESSTSSISSQMTSVSVQ